ncbi:MAG: hypothetical protein RL385_1094 [Pseudomonadota bacterium]|jgi:hypothetical protein
MRAPIITTDKVAAALGWSTKRARRWLLTTGAGEKRAGRVITTPTKLVEHFPEVWGAIASGVSDTDDEE